LKFDLYPARVPVWPTVRCGKRNRDLKLQSRVLYPMCYDEIMLSYAKLHTFSTRKDMLTQTDKMTEISIKFYSIGAHFTTSIPFATSQISVAFILVVGLFFVYTRNCSSHPNVVLL